MKMQDGVEGLSVIIGKYLFVIIGLIGLFISGYERGKSITTNKYKAIVAKLESEYAKNDQARYQAIAEVEQQARIRLQQQTEHIRSLMKELGEVRKTLTKERNEFKGKINEVSKRADSYCLGLPSEWVSTYNQVLGLTSSSNNTRGKNAHTRGSASDTGTAGTTNARIQQNQLAYSSSLIQQHTSKQNNQSNVLEKESFIKQSSNNTLPASSSQTNESIVTPKDLLSHIQDYGLYCRRIETQLHAIGELLEAQQ